MKTTTLTALTIALAALLGTSVAAQSATPPAAAGMPIIYPAKGQSPQQQDKDKYQCYGWAREQSGFDPMQAVPQQVAQPSAQQSIATTAPPAVSGGALVKGAAVGAAAGELASNDAGRGAAAGALTGVVLQNVRQRQAAQAKQQQQAQMQAQQQAQQQAARNQQKSMFDRAFGACMDARGYAVK